MCIHKQIEMLYTKLIHIQSHTRFRAHFVETAVFSVTHLRGTSLMPANDFSVCSLFSCAFPYLACQLCNYHHIAAFQPHKTYYGGW